MHHVAIEKGALSSLSTKFANFTFFYNKTDSITFIFNNLYIITRMKYM